MFARVSSHLEWIRQHVPPELGDADGNNTVDIVDANADTVADCGFCGFKDPKQEGYRRKVAWLRKRFAEGLKYKVLEARGEGAIGFIEYIPGEYTWRPIEAPGYMVVHCVMIHRKAFKGKGYGGTLVEECVEDARRAKMHGVAVVTSGGTWMASTRESPHSSGTSTWSSSSG